MGAGRRTICCLISAASLSAGLGGCTTAFDSQRKFLETSVATGRFAEVARDLDDPAVQDMYGEKNRLLYWLDRGTLAMTLGENERAIELLEKAESWMQERNSPGFGDEAARWLLNDTAAPYYGEPYEDVYVNVVKLLAQLASGNLQGGATVEARRLSSKADALRDRYLKWRDVVYQKGGDGFDRAAAGGSSLPSESARTRTVSTASSEQTERPRGRPIAPANEEGQFIESTLGTYLTAITFMKSGETEFQRVAGRRLVDSIRLQRGLIGRVREEDFASVSDLRAGDVDVLFVALSGTAPTKEAFTVGPIPVFTWPVYFQLPELVGGSGRVARARAVIEAMSGDGRVREVDLALVEDMRAVATENHRRQLPLIYARTLLRASAKAGVSFAISESIRNSSGRGRDSERDLMVIGSVIAGMAVLALTEKADLRCWATLPGLAHVGTADLPPGEYRSRIEYLSSSGGVRHAAEWRMFTIEEDSGGTGLVSIVQRYWE